MEEYIRLQHRNDELWDLLADPDLPPLDRQAFNREMLVNIIQIVIFETHYEDEDDFETCESQSIGPDEYDREGPIVYDGFDLAGEI